MKKVFFIILFFFCFKIYSEDCNSLISTFDKPVSLNGGWLFQKGDNNDWKNKELDDTSWQKRSLPDAIRDPNPNVEITGYYWYRCRILFPENAKDTVHSIAINLGKIKDADEVFFNGKLIGSTGKFLPSLVSDFEKDRIYSISSDVIESGLNVLSIRIYTSTDFVGLVTIPRIGYEIEINRQNNLKEIFNITFGFVFIAMGLFFGIGSVLKSTNRSNLFFALFSISLGIYILIRSQYRYRLFTSFSLSYRTELILLMILPVLFLNFIAFYVNHPRRFYIWLFEILMGIGILFTAIFAKSTPVWEAITDILPKLLLYPLGLVIYITYRNYLKHKRKLKYIFWGIVFLAPCIILDILKALELIRFPSTSHFGFMFLLINISIQLSEEMVENYRKFISQENDLKKMEKQKTKFLVNLSSEFKFYMDNMIKIGKDLLLEPEHKQTLTRLKTMESYQALTRAVISDAVVLNQIENREYENVIEKFSIKDLIEDTIQIIETRLSQKRINKTISITYGDFEIMQSKELIYLIFYHLIENIYKYTEPEKAFQIIVKSDLKTEMEIQVIDEGPGISIYEKADLFKKFVRGANIPESIPGVGIGIPLVKSISTYLGGNLELIGAKGAGCKIIITIPT